MAGDESLVRRDEEQVALGRALALWAEATTDAASARRPDLLRDKQKAVADFFAHTGKGPAEVTPLDVEAWRRELERRRPRLAPATVYYRLARLASFFSSSSRTPITGRWSLPSRSRLGWLT